MSARAESPLLDGLAIGAALATLTTQSSLDAEARSFISHSCIDLP